MKMNEIGMCNVFLIEDDLERQTYNANVLTELGYHVTAFTDPRLALKALEENDEPDAIFVSFDIPQMYNTHYFNVIGHVCPNVPMVVTSLSPFPSPDIMRLTPHIRYRLFGKPRKETVQMVMESIFLAKRKNFQ